MLCFGLFTAEALVADVHDGDATHAELVRIDGEQHADRHAVAAADVDHLPGERGPGEDGHAQHACHCVHAHGAWYSALSVDPAATVTVATTPPALNVYGVPNPALEPRLRPPNA